MRTKTGNGRWVNGPACTETVLSRRGYYGAVPLGQARRQPLPKSLADYAKPPRERET